VCSLPAPAVWPHGKTEAWYILSAASDATVGVDENLHLIYSDDLMTWAGGVAILKPQFPWEFVQIGTCGSPIELDEGWLLLIHGVGAVRKYTIGAILLEMADPSKGLGRLSAQAPWRLSPGGRQPLLTLREKSGSSRARHRDPSHRCSFPGDRLPTRRGRRHG
jgi:hypothetical protein